MIPRPALVAAGPLLGAATALAALRGTEVPTWVAVVLVAVAAVGLAVAGHHGGDVALTFGLGAVGVAIGATLVGDGSPSLPAVALWTAGAVGAGEATGLARRTRSVAVPDAGVVGAELTGAAAIVASALVGAAVLLGAGDVSGPDGLVGEVLALVAVVGLGALVGATPAGRRAVRSLLVRRDP